MVRRLVNEAIRADEVLLVDENGADLGAVARAEALALARARRCDLVQDGAFSSPPRCHLVPAGDAAAQAARATRYRAAGPIGGPPKEIRVSTAMAAHDVETRRRQAAGLLARGYTVKLSARLAKAEHANPAAARALLEDLAGGLADVGRVARKPYNEAGALALLLAPRDEEQQAH